MMSTHKLFITNQFTKLWDKNIKFINSLSQFEHFSIKEAQLLNKIFQQWFHTSFSGLEHIDHNKPALYVSNHTTLGIDSPSLIFGLYVETGIFLRGTADKGFFQPYYPFVAKLFHHFGAFKGTRPNIANLMQQQAHILLYPGGGREVLKNKHEAYQLLWKDRYGFIELAIEHGYDIVPFVSLGGDEAFNIHYDAEDFRKSQLSQWLFKSEKLKTLLRHGEIFLPLMTGYKGLPFIPKRQKLHFHFLDRIETNHISKADIETEKYKIRAQIMQQLQHILATKRIMS